MSEFGDISRMDLSSLERKGYHPEDDDEEELDQTEDSGQAGEETAAADSDRTGTEIEVLDSEIVDLDQDPGDEVVIEDVETVTVDQVESDGREHMKQPQGKYYYVDAKITPKEMTAFLFAHNYRSPLMILATLVGLVWPIYTVVRNQGSPLMALMCAAIFLVLMPVSIWRRGTTSVTQNPMYENTFHYMLDEAGLHLELGEHAVDVEWSKVTRTLYLKSSTVIYTGKANAFLIPVEAMGARKDEIQAFIRSHTGR